MLNKTICINLAVCVLIRVPSNVFLHTCVCVCVCVIRGVSMFAMLTGTLPFMVEPFNIKQLHQKMVNGEISAIPNDVSKGDLPSHKSSQRHRRTRPTDTYTCVSVCVCGL